SALRQRLGRQAPRMTPAALAEGRAPDAIDSPRGQRVAELVDQQQREISKRSDRLLAVLMAIQWLAGIAAALWISPRAWSGATSRVHLHVWAALFLGGAI